MKKTAFMFLLLLLVAGVALEQTPPQTSVNLLGAHNVGGRGCLGCHPASSSSDAVRENALPWGASSLPLYGKTIAFGDAGRWVEVLPTDIAIRSREVDGILVCLSCHDGNVTPPSMMAGQSFEQRIGLLPSTSYGPLGIPTLLGSDNYANDHPVGTAAVIRPGQGLMWMGNTFRVAPGTPYAQFVAHYGRPALTPGRFKDPWGINNWGEPFVLCTTCHNQHVMSIYASTSASPIADDGGGRFYSTFFFINAPYNPAFANDATPNASSATQFCRQCHFTNSNEANNSNTVLTTLPNF